MINANYIRNELGGYCIVFKKGVRRYSFSVPLLENIGYNLDKINDYVSQLDNCSLDESGLSVKGDVMRIPDEDLGSFSEMYKIVAARQYHSDYLKEKIKEYIDVKIEEQQEEFEEKEYKVKFEEEYYKVIVKKRLTHTDD